MRKRISTLIVFIFSSIWTGVIGIPAECSELRLRKELVAKQSDRALAFTHGLFDHVKDKVNPLGDDCDLHAPIRVDEIRVAVVG